jgi:hypothetical protein
MGAGAPIHTVPAAPARVERTFMKHTLAPILMVLVLVAAGIVPAPASAATQTFRNVQYGLCLDSNANSDVYTHPCGSDYQRWVVIAAGTSVNGNNIRQLRSNMTGLCLDTNIVGEIFTLACEDTPFQRWEIFVRSNGIKFRNMQTRLCLASRADRSVYSLDCNAAPTNAQRWN